MELGSFFKSMDHYLNLSFEGKHCWVRASLQPANFFLMEDDYRSIKRGKRFWFRMRNELWIYHFTLYMNLFSLWQEKSPCVVSRLFCFYLTQASFFILDFHIFSYHHYSLTFHQLLKCFNKNGDSLSKKENIFTHISSFMFKVLPRDCYKTFVKTLFRQR